MMSRNCRNLLKLSSLLHSSRPVSSVPRLFTARPFQVENTQKWPIHSMSTKSPGDKIQVSKIQLIAPHLRKTNRRRRPLATLYKDNENSLPKVVGIAKAESFDLCAIFEDENFSSFYQVTFVDEDAEDALHIVPKSEYRISGSTKDAFVFDDGVVVAWNMNDEELGHLTDFLQPFENDPYSVDLVQQEKETIAFQYGSNGSRVFIKNDVLNLLNPEDENAPRHVDVLDRFAIAHGLAASVKIAIWEQRLNDYAEPLYETTKNLIRGNIPWSRKESLQKTGQFAALRQSINLDSGLLNTDFYWERDNLERYYNMTKKYFVVDKRLRELNSRLDHCQQFVSIIDDMLTHRHSSRLEWLIIWLIIVEVVFDFLHYFDYTPARFREE